MQEYTVRKITSENNLLEIVDFLKDGFNQSNLFAKKLKKYFSTVLHIYHLSALV